MKKYMACALIVSALWIVIFCFFGGFQNENDQNEKSVQKKQIKEDEIEVCIVDESWMWIPEEGAPETWEVVIDEKLAAQIANAVFKHSKVEQFLSNTQCKVYDNPESKIYIVIRNIGNGAAGGDYCVAIRKTDGAIVRAWIGE